MHEMQPGAVFARPIVAPEPVRQRMTRGEAKKRERVTAPMRLAQRGIDEGMERFAVVVRDGEVGQIDLLQGLSGCGQARSAQERCREIDRRPQPRKPPGVAIYDGLLERALVPQRHAGRDVGATAYDQEIIKLQSRAERRIGKVAGAPGRRELILPIGAVKAACNERKIIRSGALDNGPR